MPTTSRTSLRWAFSFHLVHVQNLHAYTMWARTEEDKNKWVAAIREALGNVLPLGQPPSLQVPQQQGTSISCKVRLLLALQSLVKRLSLCCMNLPHSHRGNHAT